jgi:hypothetical protein
MSTSTAQAQKVTVNIYTMTATAVTNGVFNMLFRIVKERGLPADYISDNRKVIEDGLFAWVSEQTLTKISLEIFQEGNSTALEKYNFDFEYLADPRMEPVPPSVASLQKLCKTLDNLPPQSKYRVVAFLADGATKVAGWSDTEPKDIDVTKEASITDWGFGHAAVKLTYQGGKW